MSESEASKSSGYPLATHAPRIEAFMGKVPSIDASALVHPTAVVIGDVTIGAACSIWPNVTLRGDEGRIEVGRDTNIQDGSVVHMTSDLSDTIIGQRVTVGHGAILHGCQIADDCLVGMGAIVMDNVKIGPWCLIAAGTLLIPGVEIPEGSVVMGSPGRVRREVGEKERTMIAYSWKHYCDQADRHRGDVS